MAMRVSELQQALWEVEHAAVLVPARVLERLIQQHYKLSGLFGQTPHRKGLVIDRTTLFRYVDQDELDLDASRVLPQTLLLLARPSQNTVTSLDRPALLLTYWRRLFHVSVDAALQQKVLDGRLSPVQVRERIDAIGTSEFAEIRMVLEQEHLLLPPADDTEVYCEFAALYLELRYFARTLVPVYFPGLPEGERIADILAQDVDAPALFERTRLPGAGEPVVRTDTLSDESNDYYWRLMRSAQRADQERNTVRAAIVRTRAARVAPGSLTESTRRQARADLQLLTRRLQRALELDEGEVAQWLEVLPALLDKADQGSWTSEAALLYDLQKVGVDHERDIYALDLVVWVTSGGQRPIKRPLPAQKLVRITRHLRSAAQRLTTARLSDDDRRRLVGLLDSALHRSEERLRDRLRPVLHDAFISVGLQPGNPPERTAFARMIEEILDRISEAGFLSFGDLRDTISRNQLKLADVADVREFLRGDPLLRLDRRLASALDGVYRPGEVYLRWLERITAPAYGTPIGRRITRFFVIPFGGALALLQGLHLILQHLVGLIKVPVPVGDGAVQYLPLQAPPFDPLSGLTELRANPADVPVLPLACFLATGFFLLALMQSPRLRRVCALALRWSYRALRAVFVDAPLWLVRRHWLQQLLDSGPFQLFWSFLLKPFVVCALLWLWVPETSRTWLMAGSTFVAINFVLNSRLGRVAGDLILQSFVDFYELLRAGLLPGLFRLVLWLFKQIIEVMEFVLHTVDDWLRFRTGDSRLSLVVRTVFGLLWYPIAALARFYLVVLIEPGFNPIKAPISILAAKVIYLWYIPLTQTVAESLTPLLGNILASAFAGSTIWLLPDAFGFLIWEMKENWSLYRANRQTYLRPVAVGPHGETVRRLLQPGFHSGTVPKLFSRLRQAEREGILTGNWRGARTSRRSLQEVARLLQRLVSRETVPLLQESSRWKGQPVKVGQVTLTPKRIEIELTHADHADNPAWIEWEEQQRWLVARVQRAGWLKSLTEEQAQAVTTALAGLYKLAGIDLVHEQVEYNLPARRACYELTERDLVIRSPARTGRSIHYDLTRPAGPLKPRNEDGKPVPDWPPLDPGRILFARVPLSWRQWVASWQSEPDARRTLAPGIRVLPVEEPAPQQCPTS
jgi:hypothetical protein